MLELEKSMVKQLHIIGVWPQGDEYKSPDKAPENERCEKKPPVGVLTREVNVTRHSEAKSKSDKDAGKWNDEEINGQMNSEGKLIRKGRGCK
ncbi:MAG: hypothetical protein ACRESZ_18600 [Methylococcales bacterium]